MMRSARAAGGAGAGGAASPVSQPIAGLPAPPAPGVAGWRALLAGLAGPGGRPGLPNPLPVGLRLSAAAVRDLADKQARGALKALLAAKRLRPVTADGRAVGPWPGGAGTEAGGDPDWTSAHRAEHTIAMAELMADLTEQRTLISLVTPIHLAPLADPDRAARMAATVLRVAAFCHDLRQQTRRVVTLALAPHGPGPAVHALRSLFVRDLFGARGTRMMAGLAGLDRAAAAAALPRHLGIAWQIGGPAGPAATDGTDGTDDDPLAPLRAFAEAGIPVVRLALAGLAGLSRRAGQALPPDIAQVLDRQRAGPVAPHLVLDCAAHGPDGVLPDAVARALAGTRADPRAPRGPTP